MSCLLDALMYSGRIIGHARGLYIVTTRLTRLLWNLTVADIDLDPGQDL